MNCELQILRTSDGQCECFWTFNLDEFPEIARSFRDFRDSRSDFGDPSGDLREPDDFPAEEFRP